MQKLSEIEEKLKKEHIDIKNRYVKLKRCKICSFNFKNNIVIIINRSIFSKSINYNCFKYCPYYR